MTIEKHDFLLFENSIQLTGGSTPNEMIVMACIYQLPVDRAKNGNTCNCEDAIAGMMSANITLTVMCEWSSSYSLVFGLDDFEIKCQWIHSTVYLWWSVLFLGTYQGMLYSTWNNLASWRLCVTCSWMLFVLILPWREQWASKFLILHAVI